jgi:hypothetical protein
LKNEVSPHRPALPCLPLAASAHSRVRQIARHLDDIQYLKGVIEPDPDSYETVLSLAHGGERRTVVG